jgi:uncharacterized protein (DUF2236 family)
MVSQALVRYASDAVLLVGGARAILLQVADPAVAAGVARHSDFAHRPVERLHHTLSYAYAVVLGSPDVAARAARFVTHAHAPVERAEDAGLQLWVAATLYETAVLVHDTVYGPVEGPLADEFYSEYSRLGTALQVPAELWPASRTAFADYWGASIRQLDVSADARRIAHDLFHPAVAPWWLRAGLPLARLLTVDLLPSPIRRAYGFRHGLVRRWQARQAWRLVRFVAMVLPARAKAIPARMLLQELRRGV